MATTALAKVDSNKRNRGGGYPASLRAKVLGELASGTPVKDLAAKYKLSDGTVRNWVAAAMKGAGVGTYGNGHGKTARANGTPNLPVPYDPHAAPIALEELANLRDEGDYMKRLMLWLVFKLAPPELEAPTTRRGRR